MTRALLTAAAVTAGLVVGYTAAQALRRTVAWLDRELGYAAIGYLDGE
jgi:hypothetical protein